MPQFRDEFQLTIDYIHKDTLKTLCDVFGKAFCNPLTHNEKDRITLITLFDTSLWKRELSLTAGIAGLAIIVPWVRVRFDPVFRSMFTKKPASFMSTIVVIPVVVSIILYVLGVLLRIAPHWLVASIFALFVIFVVALIAYAVGRPLLDSVKDLAVMRRANVRARFARPEIVDILSRLKTTTFRKRFVQTLSERKVIATGEWPDGFSLSSRSDPAISDLARLEEKWLGLDR